MNNSDDDKVINGVIKGIVTLRKSGKTDKEISEMMEAQGMQKESVQKFMELSRHTHYLGSMETQEKKAKGVRNIIFGALWFVGGTVVTLATYSAASGGGRYMIAYGAIFGGLVQLIIGIVQAASK